MKLCYVAQPLPDEILYSYLGRLSLLNGLGSPARAVEILYGNRNVTPGVDLPTQLQALFDRVGDQLPYASPSALLMSMTLYPYFRSFLPHDRDEAACERMISGNSQGLKTFLGLVANGFGAVTNLRYCRECNAVDLMRCGTPYWHRTHQLPGVTECVEHKEILKVLAPTIGTRCRQRIVVAPCVMPDRANSSPPSNVRALEFATLSSCFLRPQRHEGVTPRVIGAAYLNETRKLGLTTRTSSVDLPALSSALLAYYDSFQMFPFARRVVGMARGSLRWLSPLYHLPDRYSHPICHILLIQFLFGSIETFDLACSASKKELQLERVGNAALGGRPRQCRTTYQPGQCQFDTLALSRRKRRCGNTDWAEWDLELSRRIRERSRILKGTSSCRRASRDYLLLGVDHRKVLSHPLELPETSRALSCLEESQLASQLRRLEVLCRDQSCMANPSNFPKLQRTAQIRLWSEHKFSLDSVTKRT